jgi:hypothetical protein
VYYHVGYGTKRLPQLPHVRSLRDEQTWLARGTRSGNDPDIELLMLIVCHFTLAWLLAFGGTRSGSIWSICLKVFQASCVFSDYRAAISSLVVP